MELRQRFVIFSFDPSYSGKLRLPQNWKPAWIGIFWSAFERVQGCQRTENFFDRNILSILLEEEEKDESKEIINLFLVLCLNRVELLPPPPFVYFSSFQATYLVKKIVDFCETRIRIAGVEGKHADL